MSEYETLPNQDEVRLLQLFFGCADRDTALQFFESVYCHKQYDVAVNESQPNIIPCTNLQNIFFAKNYNKRDDIDENSNDIHPDFVNFLINVAMWHNDLDRTNHKLDYVNDVREIVQKALIVHKNNDKNTMLNDIDKQVTTLLTNNEGKIKYDTKPTADYVNKHTNNLNADKIVKLIVDNIDFNNYANDNEDFGINEFINLFNNLKNNNSEIMNFLNANVELYYDEYEVREENSFNGNENESGSFFEYGDANDQNTVRNFNIRQQNNLEKSTSSVTNESARRNRFKGGAYDKNRPIKPHNTRINLNKDSNGQTIFSRTLPLVPDIVTNIYADIIEHDNAGNSSKHIINLLDVIGKENKTNALRIIYDAVHNDMYDEKFKHLHNIFNDSNVEFDEVKKFDINVIKITQNRINNELNNSNDHDVESFDDIWTHGEFQELDSNVIYGRNENGQLYYREKDDSSNTKHPINNEVKISSILNCELNGKIGNTQCNDVIACILSGNQRELAKCLKNVRDDEVYNLAGRELEKKIQGNTQLIKELLKTFGIKIISENGELRPQNFDTWMFSLNGNLQQIIQKNTKLQQYLRGVIDFVIAHPQIYNENYSEKNENPRDASNKNVPFFINPSSDKHNRLRYVAKSINQGNVFSNHIMPINKVLPINAKFGPLFGGLSGGGMDDYTNSIIRKINRGERSSDMLVVLLQSVLTDLGEVGVNLHVNDKKSIDNAIKDIQRIESKTEDLVNMLRTLSDLLNWFKKTGYEHNITNNLNLRKFQKQRELLDMLTKNVAKMEGCINNNISKQDTLTTNVVEQLHKLLEQVTSQ